MRIDLSSNFLPAEGAPAVQSDARAGGVAPTSKPASDSAQPSSNHLSAAALTAAVSELPDVRQEKVAALTEQLRSGTYAVSATQTAEAMLSQMRMTPEA